MISSTITGHVGELLVAADLFKRGYRVSLAGAGFPYDLIAEMGGKAILIQVKTTSKPNYSRGGTYIFSINSKRSAREFDVVALIALDTGAVGYLAADDCAEVKAHFMPPNTQYGFNRKVKNLDENTLEDALSLIDRLNNSK